MASYIGTDTRMEINECLRNGKQMNFLQRKTCDTLQNVISKNRLDTNVIRAQYVDPTFLEKNFNITISREQNHSEFINAENIINKNISKTITNKGFTSISLTNRSIFS